MYEIKLREEYQRRIAKTYEECTDRERREIIELLCQDATSEKIEKAVSGWFLIHVFMLGLQNIEITVQIPDQMQYSSCNGGSLRDYGKNEDALKTFVCQSKPYCWETTVSLLPNTEVYNWNDVEVIAACCCRQLYQKIAISPENGLLLKTGSELTRRPEGAGYYSLAYGDENDGVMQVPSLADLYTYMDSVTVQVPGFAISPIKAAERKKIIIGCGWHASKVIAKTIEKIDQEAWKQFWCYFIDPMSVNREWEELLHVEDLKGHQCSVTAVVSPDRYCRGIGATNRKVAERIASVTKRYLQEIFADAKGDETVIVCHANMDYFSNAFVTLCTEFIEKLGLQVLVIPMQLVPFVSFNELVGEMSGETMKELIRLSESSDHIELLMEENAGVRFNHYWEEHPEQERLISYLYEDSERFYGQMLIGLLEK